MPGATMPRSFARNRETAKRNATIFNKYNELKADGSRRYRQVDLAEMFGLKQCTISQIVNNPNAHLY